MKNTIENKQRFFALYWDQEVQMHVNGNIYKVGKIKPLAPTISHLELKPLSEITKEESDYISRLKVICHSDGTHDLEPMQHTTDYLRSRGYLLPFMDLTIEQILEYGWAVLKSK